MRIAIASRIFEPEPSAASFRLSALANTLAERGHATEVLTVRPAAGLRGRTGDADRPYRVRRAPVLRDAHGYVRGYVQYLSFDVPLFFRILFGPKRDAIVVEPPPTTGFFVRIAAALRRTPYVYYAADIWSDAASQTGAASWMLRAVRGIERFAWGGAAAAVSVSDGVTERMGELGCRTAVVTVGNGVDACRLQGAIAAAESIPDQGFVYAGTASEWHGAAILLEAYASVAAELTGHPVRFIGGGSERPALEALAGELGIADRVRFEDPKPAEELAPILAGSTAAIGSLKPGSGYDFAFPTKLYSAVVCGAPVVHTGGGPAEPFVQQSVDGTPLGAAVAYERDAVAAALVAAARERERTGGDPERRALIRNWARENVDLAAVAARVAEVVEREGTSRA